MKIRRFPLVMWCTAIISGVLTAVFAVLPGEVFLTLAITFGTVFYHFAMRLLIGAVIPNRFDYTARWFRQNAFEAKLYKLLKLRRWKGKMPTYDPRLFSTQYYTTEQIAKNMCQAELVHEVIIVLSFVPLLFSFVWGEFGVFLATSLGAAAIDLVFVMLQRYNRPRLLKILQRRTDREQNH